jgi:hypothetical protein
MKTRVAPFAVVGILLGAGVLGFVQAEAPAATVANSSPAVTAEDTATQPSLPPNHPPITSPHGTSGSPIPSGDEAPAITWTVPSGWQTAPSPNAMRIATYHPSPSTELSVSRAGGATEANIQRWIGQFDDAGKDTRDERTVRGMKVVVVEVAGTYLGGGMMPGPAAEKHTRWSLVGAVVETPGSHYFFKLLGPTDQVQAARPSFDTLLASIAPR